MLSRKLRAFASASSALALLGLLSACGAPVFGGSGPFARVVFVGDSLTAGFENGALLDSQQVNGYAALVAKQAKFATTLPLIASPGAPGVLQLVSLSPLPVIEQEPGITTGRDDYFARATDLAVPGHNLHDVIYREPTLTPSTDEDIITDLVLGLPTSATVPATQLAQAVSFQPTTAFVWAGSNDVLQADDAGDPSVLPSLASFTADYATLIGALKTQTSAKLVVANIPDVTAVPYMTPAAEVIDEIVAVTHIPSFLIEAGLGIQPGDKLNAQGLSDTEAEVVGLTQGHLLTPLPGSDVLTAAEIVEVQGAIVAYNQVIAQTVAAAGGTLVDLHSYFAQIEAGITIDGYPVTAAFLGGLFGLDGVHPTNTGYALVANQFIQATNTAFGLATPLVDVNAVAKADPYFPPNLKPLGGSVKGQSVRIPVTAAKVASQMLRAGKLQAPEELKQRVLGVVQR